MYVWGEIPDKAGSTISSVSAKISNESAQEVNVRTTFFGPDMDIRPDHSPQSDESSAHLVSQFPVCQDERSSISGENCETPGNLYDDLVYIDSPNVLDNFFSVLTSQGGRLDVDVAFLGNESKAQSVANAIISQHKILRAHAFGTSGRVWLNSTTGSRANTITPTSTPFSIPANVTGAERIRLVQGAISTRILEILLTLVLVLSLSSWHTVPNTKLLPREPCSIASVVALLADGDVLSLLPSDCQWMTNTELEKFFGHGIFCLQKDEEGKLGIRYKTMVDNT